jgi:hypothetical protein
MYVSSGLCRARVSSKRDAGFKLRVALLTVVGAVSDLCEPWRASRRRSLSKKAEGDDSLEIHAQGLWRDKSSTRAAGSKLRVAPLSMVGVD